MIKYRLAFTIPAETLFGLMSKVLPIEDLQVEEIVERAPPAKPTAQLTQRPERARRAGHARNLTEGTNGIILGILADGKPHRTGEIKAAFAAAGYKVNGSGSSLERQKRWGLIFQPAPGVWQKIAA